MHTNGIASPSREANSLLEAVQAMIASVGLAVNTRHGAVRILFPGLGWFLACSEIRTAKDSQIQASPFNSVDYGCQNIPTVQPQLLIHDK